MATNREHHSKQRRLRFDTRLPPNMIVALEAECNRLRTLLTQLKEQGRKPATMSFQEPDVIALVLALGIELLQKMTYEQFETELRRLVNRRS